MKNKGNVWEATKLEHFFGWDVEIISDIPGKVNWLKVKATNKSNRREVRMVEAPAKIVPLSPGTIERVSKDR